MLCQSTSIPNSWSALVFNNWKNIDSLKIIGYGFVKPLDFRSSKYTSRTWLAIDNIGKTTVEEVVDTMRKILLLSRGKRETVELAMATQGVLFSNSIHGVASYGIAFSTKVFIVKQTIPPTTQWQKSIWTLSVTIYKSIVHRIYGFCRNVAVGHRLFLEMEHFQTTCEYKFK